MSEDTSYAEVQGLSLGSPFTVGNGRACRPIYFYVDGVRTDATRGYVTERSDGRWTVSLPNGYGGEHGAYESAHDAMNALDTVAQRIADQIYRAAGELKRGLITFAEFHHEVAAIEHGEYAN